MGHALLGPSSMMMKVLPKVLEQRDLSFVALIYPECGCHQSPQLCIENHTHTRAACHIYSHMCRAQRVLAICHQALQVAMTGATLAVEQALRG